MVKRSLAVMADTPHPPLDDEAPSILYGKKQLERR
jgi:hypothetical protein